MPSFVVLVHDHPFLHWDFMLEKEALLRTWRLAKSPLEAGPVPAEALADHRRAYLDYEGPVSGNRGSVRRLDRGEYTLVQETDNRLAIRLAGAILTGTAVLEWARESGSWTFAFTPTRT